ATAVGVGTRKATETTERLLQTVSVPLVVVVGIAGATAPHLQVADVVVPEAAIHGPGSTTHTSTTSLAALDRKGTIHTHDELIIARNPHRIPHLVALARNSNKGCNAAAAAADRALKNLNHP